MTGIVTGALLGILYAPEKGSKLRRKIRKKTHKFSSDASDVSDNLVDQVDNLKDYISNFVDDIKFKFTRLESLLNHKDSDKKTQ